MLNVLKPENNPSSPPSHVQELRDEEHEHTEPVPTLGGPKIERQRWGAKKGLRKVERQKVLRAVESVEWGK